MITPMMQLVPDKSNHNFQMNWNLDFRFKHRPK